MGDVVTLVEKAQKEVGGIIVPSVIGYFPDSTWCTPGVGTTPCVTSDEYV